VEPIESTTWIVRSRTIHEVGDPEIEIVGDI